MLLEYRESINTECRVEQPTLTIQAIKIDANRNSLKQKVGCGRLKSCDYFKKRDNKLYFIEVSDFNAQMEDLSKKSTSKEAKQYIKMEVRLKLSDTLLIFQEIAKQFDINKVKISQNKGLLSLCTNKRADIVAFAYLSRELTRHYCPTHFASIQIIPYMEIEQIFQKKRRRIQKII